MSPNRIGLHHYHKRKRALKKPEKTSKFIDIIDGFMLVMAIIIPFTTISQISKIFINKSAGDISIITWSAFTFSASCWLVYSIVHKEKILIVNSILWVILESTVVIGAIIYS